MRIFKTKSLAKFTRKHGVNDGSLVDAVHRAMRGLIGADLGGRVIKQRVSRPGHGKRGGFRMLIGFGTQRSIFLYAFAKNERENIQDGELMTLQEIAVTFLNLDTEGLARALADGTLIEVHDDDQG